jgi:general secretion pathway protein G
MQDRKRKRSQARGFTLIELTITVAIIMTIAALAVPNLVSAIQLAKTARAVADVTDIEEEIALYQSIYGVLPDNLSQLGLGSYVDPWQNPYEYLNHSTMKGNGKARKDRFLVPLNTDYDLYSDGPDGKTSSPITAAPSQDDIIRASDGSYVGVAADF